jgi:hypothetical protein
VSTNRALSALGRNLLAGARLASFRSIERGDFRVDAAQLLLFLVVSALVDNATDWLRHGPDAALEGSAAGAELASFALLVAIAALLAWRFALAELVVALPIVVLASMPLVQLANLAPELVARHANVPAWLPEVLYGLVLAWFLAVLWRSTFVALGPLPARFLRATAGAVLLALPLFLPEGVMPEASWWSAREPGTSPASSSAVAEPVLALQRELQDDALNALDDHTPGETDVYFVGFAGDGRAQVWRSRLERAQRVLDAHWGTSGRSLVYLNDASALTQTPVATVTHLREALDAIGAAIDPDEDIVLLYLGGRSNPDGSLAVSLPPLGLVQLTGAGLAHLLTQAGIRYAVVVVSSCASAAFTDALSDESTVVLANADAGCAAREPTSIGDVLFSEALPAASSLRSALESAKRVAEGRGTPATLHIGESIAPLLARARVPANNRTAVEWPVRS